MAVCHTLAYRHINYLANHSLFFNKYQMKKTLSILALAACFIPAKAVYMLPAPEMLSETVEDGKITMTWQAGTDEKITDYHITVYKMHKATADETFVLAQSDFSHIESTGTMSRHEDRGAIWDYLPDCPGWYVKYPLYMHNAIGIDTFNQFPGSDNSDIFGGAYMLSPDYNLDGVHSNNWTIRVTCELANEAISVTGGFALYTWSEDWWNEANYDYKPVEGHDHHFTNLSNTAFQKYTEECTPLLHVDRTRLSFYGSGYSAIWINSFKAEMSLQADDIIGYPSETIVVKAKEGVNSYTINTAGDTDNDYVYGYIVRSLRVDYDDYRNLSTIRFISPCPEVHNVGEDFNSISSAVTDETNMSITVSGSSIVVEGVDATTPVTVYNTAGQTVASGNAAAPIFIGEHGVYIVKAGEATSKVII